ncbi:flagellar basal body-associated FliL family protein [Conexibacter sp. JD483]|uniref:flagellar basal body-associated FliL family protein n=1 Tax=unclassified Conexibacter TaxID=2627773 RepID=UPI00272933D7|nr:MULTISPECIES: flagellar basal body-associated FliL family protein [unclassified Conexibacter]MDO8188204.1 flagellar basal body-associated FliL family protein [Conexibacter sp. CPCC 205706]MDO8201832.1 flagellar basal body-associated FliL family protein [Conexibacter sp. CPCC 205762]MDR9372891.1 flagellar basal body-associated FliL family protein [Conexibacter sp. JD483]
MRKNVLILVLAALVVGAGAAYTFAKPKHEVRHKIDGTVYVLPKEFLVNLRDGRYAKLNVALVLDHSQATASSGGHGGGGAPPEGFGTLEQEAVIRDIVTDVVTDANGDELVQANGREEIKQAILARIRRTTDVRTEDVLLTDVAVQ